MADINMTRISPDRLADPPHFAPVITAEGGKQVYISGMLPTEKDGTVVGEGDLLAQARKTYDNLRIALEEVGAGPADVVRQRVFIVNLGPDDRAPFVQAMNEFYGEGAKATSTLVGVQNLIVPGARIEIDLTAVIAA